MLDRITESPGPVVDLGQPVIIQSHHQTKGFNSGNIEEDKKLELFKRARHPDRDFMYVSCRNGSVRVELFFILQLIVFNANTASGVKSMPLVKLSSIAIDKKYQRQGLLKALIKFSLIKSSQLAKLTGARVLITQTTCAKQESLLKLAGFLPLPGSTTTFFVSLE